MAMLAVAMNDDDKRTETNNLPILARNKKMGESK